MKVWNVELSERAENDLEDIFKYIALNLLEPEVARRQTSRIKDAIQALNKFPGRYPQYKKEPWLSQGLRFIVVDNYLIFFKIVESDDMVLVVTIVYMKRNIDNLSI